MTKESKGNLYDWPKLTVCLLSTLSLFVLTHTFSPFNLQVGRFYEYYNMQTTGEEHSQAAGEPGQAYHCCD